MSYLIDIQLDSTSTPLNPSLNLSLRKGRYYLTTPNAVYSYGDLYDNFQKAFHHIDFEKNKFDNLLMLGFGMGSVPFMLERVFHQKFDCTGVEADAKISEWARRYTLPDLSNSINLLHIDAFDFVVNSTEKFDLVVVDIFLDDLVPAQFSTALFLEKVKKLVSQNGFLLINRLADTATALETTQAFYTNAFLAVFPEGTYFEVDGNWILASKKVFR